MKLLLLNPPGERVYIRDYFCSKTTKSNYLFHPIDLVVLSGTAASEHDVAVLDCIAERLTPAAAERRIDALAPDVVVSLVGSVAWDEDRAFLARQHARGRRVLAIGDVLHEASEQRLREEPWLEAALHVFANDDLLRYLRGERDTLEDMTVRDAEGATQRLLRVERKRRKGEFRVPRPRHELFPREGYHFSFARSRRFATVLTDYGCPYPCTFCVIGTLGFQTRPVDDVLEELDRLRADGVRELFFLDQTFGVVRERGLALCRALAERGDLSWTAYTRPDTADDELLAAMRRAGCHTVILGVESADDALLAAYRKGYRSHVVADAFRRAKRHGLRTVGTFIVGLPEETEDSLRRTLDLAIGLEMDFMSINMAVPRFGTPFRAQALALGLCDAQDLVMDQGGAAAFLPTSTLDRSTMLRLKKRMVRRFYLRPRYLLRRLRDVASPWELGAQLREGLALLKRNV
ncbi:MAG TPA: radical SAM protein [Planctomycetota bacterium]|nr:radical SAM protein [Planctomycetota bacterium]